MKLPISYMLPFELGQIYLRETGIDLAPTTIGQIGWRECSKDGRLKVVCVQLWEGAFNWEEASE